MTEQRSGRVRRSRWRCPACETLVPREEPQCACGFLKTWRSAMPPRRGFASPGLVVVALAVLAAVAALWLLLN